MAYERARQNGGVLVFRDEDLDPQRSRPEYASAMLDDLKWLGINWEEGPDIGGPYGPYRQSQRRSFYLDAWRRLLRGGFIYPCHCSRKELMSVAQAPHDGDDEPVYPGSCRGRKAHPKLDSPDGVNWRFRVPDGEVITFEDGVQGNQTYVAGRDFGDFVVWRRDDVPSYQLAVVVDDAGMWITEVVRGADLLRSTARQILLQRALGLPEPVYYHCELVVDADGVRLAKRHDALSLRSLRGSGVSPDEIRAKWNTSHGIKIALCGPSQSGSD